MSILLSTLAFLPRPVSAQWAWAKKISISTESHWRGFAMDSSGNFYFSGISDKMAQPNPRAFVVVKYNSDTTAGWDGRLYGPATITDHSDVGVDAAGNVYAIGTFKGTVTRPDSTKLVSVGDGCLVVKYDSKGKHQWSKVLALADYTSFKVHSNGTLGVHVPNFMAANNVAWGDTTFNLPAGDGYLEIGAEGNLLTVTGLTALSPSPIRWLESPAPGKLRVVNGLKGLYPGEANYLKVAEIDLASKAITSKPDSAKITSTISGNPDLEQFQYEEKTGHLFLMAYTRTGSMKVNDKDSLTPWLNNLSHVYHLLEFNEKMELVNRFMHTNPVLYAVRDSQIVVQAVVHRNAGFFSDHGTIAAKGPADGHMTYVMDRNLKFRKRGMVEAPSSGSTDITPVGVVIDAQGGIFLGMKAGYTVNYQRANDVLTFAAPLATSAAIFVVSKMGDSAAVGIADRGRAFAARSARMHVDPFASLVRIERKGRFSYDLTDLSGKSLIKGKGIDAVECDVSRFASGSYLVRIDAGGQPETFPLSVE
jgi:hypothetical protein